MSETPMLLPYFPKGEELKIVERAGEIDQYRSVAPSYDIAHYVVFRKWLDNRRFFVKDSEFRINENVYSNLLNTYRIYGSGYSDAARRYRYEFINQRNMIENHTTIKDESFRLSRISFSLFSVFIVMILVAVVTSVRGILGSSSVTIELSLVFLSVSLCSGLTWLGSAKIERRYTTGNI